MALGCSFGVMAILVTETLITLGAALQCWCQGQGHLSPHQQEADEIGDDMLGGAGEERLGEVLGGRGGYGSGYARTRNEVLTPT